MTGEDVETGDDEGMEDELIDDALSESDWVDIEDIEMDETSNQFGWREQVGTLQFRMAVMLARGEGILAPQDQNLHG